MPIRPIEPSDRERTLGSDIRTSLVQLARSPSEDLRIHIATQLGRALHPQLLHLGPPIRHRMRPHRQPRIVEIGGESLIPRHRLQR